MDLQMAIFESKMKGHCCSQIIMDLALTEMNLDNPGLISAMKGLCNGLQLGSICGTLSAATCLFFMLDPEKAAQSMNQELADWFEETFGCLECARILEGDPLARVDTCPLIIERTYEKVVEILLDHGIFLDGQADL